MKSKILSLTLVALFVNTFANGASACKECDKMTDLLLEIKSAKVAMNKTAKKPKKLVDGPSDEEKQMEIVQANSYRYVCDFNESKATDEERKAIIGLVTGIYELGVDGVAIADMYQCFHKNYQKSQQQYLALSKNMKLSETLKKVVREGRPDSNDSPAQ